MPVIMNSSTNSPILKALCLKIQNTLGSLVGIISVWKHTQIELRLQVS